MWLFIVLYPSRAAELGQRDYETPKAACMHKHERKVDSVHIGLLNTISASKSGDFGSPKLKDLNRREK